MGWANAPRASHLTLRIDEKTFKGIAFIAHRDKISRAEVVRGAIEALPDSHEPVSSSYEA